MYKPNFAMCKPNFEIYIPNFVIEFCCKDTNKT